MRVIVAPLVAGDAERRLRGVKTRHGRNQQKPAVAGVLTPVDDRLCEACANPIDANCIAQVRTCF